MMKKVKVSAALLCALLFSNVIFAQLPPEVTEKFNEAATLLNDKKINEAIPLLQEVISQGEAADPEADLVKQAKNILPDCYFRQAVAFASAQDFQGSLAALDKANEIANQYGVVAVKNKAAQLYPRIYKAYGGPAFNEKNYAKAIEVFSQAYEKFPNDTEMAMLLAKSYGESGDLAKATEIYKSIIDLGSTHDKYQAAAAQAGQELGEYMLVDASKAAEANDLNGVVAATEALLAIDPTNGMANLMRVQTAINVKNYDAAIKYGEEALATQTSEEDKSNTYFYMGVAYQNKENKAKAIEMYRKVTAGPNAATAKTEIAALSK